MPLGASENDSSRMKGNSHVQFEFNPSTSITLEGELVNRHKGEFGGNNQTEGASLNLMFRSGHVQWGALS
jgi:hypothetical protein